MIWFGEKSLFKKSLLRHKHYVYALFKEEGLPPFYIGKGSGNRCRYHTSNPGNRAVGRLVNTLETYYVGILASSENEYAVLKLEEAFILKFKSILYGGTLLNFSSGGRNTASGYFSEQVNRDYHSLVISKQRGRAIYVDGFIFPSKRLWATVRNRDRNSLDSLFKRNLAFYVDERNYLETDKLYNKAYKDGLQRRKPLREDYKPTKNSKSRAVSGHGLTFVSICAAAEYFDVTPGAIQKRCLSKHQPDFFFIES